MKKKTFQFDESFFFSQIEISFNLMKEIRLEMKDLIKNPFQFYKRNPFKNE